MVAKLEVVRGAKPVTLSLRLPTIIGRGRGSKIKLPASTVSRNHCELYEYEGRLVVRDLGSANGTRVNGHKIAAPTFLTAEDELTVGPVTLRPIAAQQLGTASQRAPAAEDLAVKATHVEDRAVPDTAAPADPHGKLDARQTLLHDSASRGFLDSESRETVANCACETAPESDEGDSVLEYSESADGSFLGISPAEEARPAVSDAPVFEGVGDGGRPTVDSDDSALNSFFKNLDT